MRLTSRAFWLAAPGRGEIRTAPLDPPDEGEVLVRTRFSAVSRGTEALVFRGEVPVSQRTAMRAPFQEGDFPAPVKYGYLNVGVVEQGPDALRGRTVFCLYPHQTRYVVPAEAVTAVPDEVPAARAVLAGAMETALNALWDATPLLGDRIAVVGAGTIGACVAALAGQIPGVRVQLVDADPNRAHTAAALGVDFAPPPDAAGECDLVVHASATEEGVRRSLELLAPEATLLELSWYGDRDIRLPLGEAFHSRRLTLRSSQVGTVSPARRGRTTARERTALALRLLADPRFDALIAAEHSFAELPAVMAELARQPGLCHRITYPEE
jgi:threonine dehydrogenase-like Zn-dependent dehydrogenase